MVFTYPHQEQPSLTMSYHPKHLDTKHKTCLIIKLITQCKKKKTEKSAHINLSPLCAIMPGRGEDRLCSSRNLNTASWRSLSFLSSRWYCCRWLLFTALLGWFSWHSLWAAMYICCWRASSASKEFSSAFCVPCTWLVCEIQTYL